MTYLTPWTIIFDGSSTSESAGAGIILISPEGLKTELSFTLDFECTNNQAEYEALIIGLEILIIDLRASTIQIIGDSLLVLKQISGEYKCSSKALLPYFAMAVQLLD
nr:reverse transcriptase [Solanum melongena]WMB97090.1 reverse transcriptase [Solanum aethiopicum]